MSVVGQKGTIEADFMAHEITIELPREKAIAHKYSFDQNWRYVEELKHFLQLIESKTMNHDLDIQAGRRVVELLLSGNIKAITEI